MTSTPNGFNPRSVGAILIGLLLAGAGIGAFKIVPQFQSPPSSESIKYQKVDLTVRDKQSDTGLPDVNVEFSYQGAPTLKKTDSNGYVSLEIPERGDITVYLKKEEYKSEKFTINLQADRNTTRDMYMEKEFFLKHSEEIPHVLSSSTSKEAIQTPSSTPTQTPKPEPTISGEWEGQYTCSKKLTGVTIAMDQTGNKVIADFVLYSLPENSDIPPGVTRYEGPHGSAKYEGDFNSIARTISFSRGTWIQQPAPFWTAFGFYGEFNENLERFDGKMNYHRCKTIHLRRKNSESTSSGFSSITGDTFNGIRAV